MIIFITIVHIVVAVTLIGLVLVQDTKSGAVGGVFGGGSNSLLGATGGASLAAKITRTMAIIFAVTSIALSIFSSKKTSSVVDSVALPPPAATATTTEQSPSVSTTDTKAEAKAEASPGGSEKK